MKKHLFFTLLLSFTFLGYGQESINQNDHQGKRHGFWKQNYEGSKQTRYEGNFEHGKEVGDFKFYCETCKDKPSVIKTFNRDNDEAVVKYFTAKGELVSEGKMLGKERIGKWIYYHKKGNKVMSEEHYKNGHLHGRSTTYYPDGTKTEETDYDQGIKQGENNYYSPKGVLLKKLLYKNDQYHGPAFYYDSEGRLIIEGQYKNGKKDGLWRYFENGKLIKEEHFPKKHK